MPLNDIFARPADSARLSPPRARLALHVGVTGHRSLPEADPARLTAAVREALGQVQTLLAKAAPSLSSLYAPGAPVLRCVSSLAEGADRIVAQAALAAGWEAQAPLPFPREEYEKDFPSEPARQEFRALLDAATAALELPGDPEARPEAYLEAGRVMLAHSDALIAVWDGRRARGAGGTGQIVRLALEAGLPVIVIAAAAPHAIRVLLPQESGGRCAERHAGADEAWRKRLDAALRRRLNPFGPAPADQDSRFPWAYFRERRRDVALLSKLSGWAEAALLGRKPRFTVRLASLDDVQAGGWRQPWRAAPEAWREHGDRLTQALHSHFAWADHLAVRYAGAYRAVGLLRYALLLPMIAGLLAGFYFESFSKIGFAVQALSLFLVLWLARLNSRRVWHRRLCEYRQLAELLRHYAYLAPLGVTPSLGQPTADSGRRGERGVVSLAVPEHHAPDRPGVGAADAGGAQAPAPGGRRGRRAGSGPLLPAARTGLRDHLQAAGAVRRVFNMVGLVVPALAPVFFGLRAQGEYARLSARYVGMGKRLLQERGRMLAGALPDHEFPRWAERMAGLMLDEVADWRTLVAAKGLSAY